MEGESSSLPLPFHGSCNSSTHPDLGGAEPRGCTQAVTSPLEGDISREGTKQGSTQSTQSTQSTETCSEPHIPSAPPEHLWGTEHSVAPGGDQGHRPAAQHRLNKATFVTHAASRVRAPATNAFPREHCPGGGTTVQRVQHEWLLTIGCLWFPVRQSNPMLAMGHVTAHLGSVLEAAGCQGLGVSTTHPKVAQLSSCCCHSRDITVALCWLGKGAGGEQGLTLVQWGAAEMEQRADAQPATPPMALLQSLCSGFAGGPSSSPCSTQLLPHVCLQHPDQHLAACSAPSP